MDDTLEADGAPTPAGDRFDDEPEQLQPDHQV